MKRIKKVAVTPRSDTVGSIIDSLYSGSDGATNAPSINAVKSAIGQLFFVATASGSGASYRYYTITSQNLPAEPVDGMTIKVVFPAAHSNLLVHLRFNSGNYHQCMMTDVTGAAGVNSYPNITTNRVYELVFYNNSWYFLSAFKKITSDNIDFATFAAFAFGQRNLSTPVNQPNGTFGVHGLSTGGHTNPSIVRFVNTDDTTSYLEVLKSGRYLVHTSIRFRDGSGSVYGGFCRNKVIPDDENPYGCWSQIVERLTLDAVRFNYLNAGDVIDLMTQGRDVANIGFTYGRVDVLALPPE